MKKLFITTALIIGLITFAQGQEKTSVGILPFTFVQDATSSQYVTSIQETVTNAFVKAKRFNIVDRTKMNSLKNEKELQKSEDYIDGSVIQQGISLGANFLISGHVISAQAERMETAPTETGEITVTYKSKLAISLKVINVATGQVVSSETIEPKGGSTLGGMFGIAPSTPEAAISKAIQDIEDKVDDFVNENFPVTFSIVEIQEIDKKGNATRVLIAGGSDFNLQRKDKLQVVEVSYLEVNGKKLERKKELGELKIEKVEGENFSTCSVSSGGDNINARFQADAQLLVITKS